MAAIGIDRDSCKFYEGRVSCSGVLRPFHSSTYLFVVAGLFTLWRGVQRRHLFWSSKLLGGTILFGFGIFNTLEGVINHHILGTHHVNETVAREYWIFWDIGFTLSGILMMAIGWFVMRRGDRESPLTARGARP